MLESKIILGDCIEFMASLSDNCIDMVLTDIPYDEVNRQDSGLRSLDYGSADIKTFDLLEFCKEIDRLFIGSAYIFCGTSQVSSIYNYFQKEKQYTVRQCVWLKPNPSPMNGQHTWLSGIENCMFIKKKSTIFNYSCKLNYWNYKTEPKDYHPTAKPLGLFEYLIKASSKEGDLIFDPCMGSGTTCIAAKNLGRKYLGIEKEKEYFEIAKQRLGQESLFNA